MTNPSQTTPGANDNPYAVAAATAEEQDAMYNALRTLDAGQAGLTRDKLRVLYPRAPWGSLIAALNALVESGRVQVRRGGQNGLFEYYTWQ